MKIIDANPIDEKKVVEALYKRSLSPIHIAEAYDCDLNIILEILGLEKKSKKEIEKLHREKNFYDHGRGFDTEESFEFRMNHYGKFLHEGDFEKYMPYCFMSRLNPKFWITKFLVHRIKKTDSDLEEARRIWVLMRFEKYQEEKWANYNTHQLEHIRKL